MPQNNGDRQTRKTQKWTDVEFLIIVRTCDNPIGCVSSFPLRHNIYSSKKINSLFIVFLSVQNCRFWFVCLSFLHICGITCRGLFHIVYIQWKPFIVTLCLCLSMSVSHYFLCESIFNLNVIF